MPSFSFPTLQKLHDLDKFSPDFGNQLCNLLHGEEYAQCLPNLEGDDLGWLVDYLDETLDGLDPSSSASRKCLLELKHVCGTKGTLPTPYTQLPPGLVTNPEPFAGGGSGDVYEGTLDGSKVCVKRVRMYTQDGPQKAIKVFCEEAVVWKRLNHTNLLPLLGVTRSPLLLISEWIPGGDLLRYIKNNPTADRLGLASDIARGLSYLHFCNIIHGDLKGRNVLVDGSGKALIADFGLAAVTRSADSIRTLSPQHGHTVRWSAPEILNEAENSKEADIFSFAMVMIEVFTGAVPFGDLRSVGAMLAITQGKRPPRPTHPNFTETLWTLIQRCWDQRPDLRPEAPEVLQVLIEPENPAWKRLIDAALNTNERAPLVTTIFSDSDQVKMVEHLDGDDAQRFIDLNHEVLDILPRRIRRRCIRTLYTICDHRTLFPRSLEIPLSHDLNEPPLCHGGFADVWKGQYNGREVAFKALRVYSQSELHVFRRRFCREVTAWKALHHPNVLTLLGITMLETRFVMVSEWMDCGNIDTYVRAHPGADRLDLLRDVARGLAYVHGQGIIHGNIESANILIGDDGRARLAGFGFFTMPSGWSTNTSPATEGGVVRWMSPELLNPDILGLEEAPATKASDCYALGMVTYEVLSGHTPFAQYTTPEAIWRVIHGERPQRPQEAEGALITDSIWDVLERCWKSRPHERIKVKDILIGLGGDFKPDESDDATSDLGPPIIENDNRPFPDVETRPGNGSRDLQTNDRHQSPPQKIIKKPWNVSKWMRGIRRIFKGVAVKFSRGRKPTDT